MPDAEVAKLRTTGEKFVNIPKNLTNTKQLIDERSMADQSPPKDRTFGENSDLQNLGMMLP